MAGLVPYFFFSYSRVDALDRFVHRFYRDLERELSVRGGLVDGDVGYLDVDQAPGVEWSKNAGAALSTCDVFVPLFSPTYFTRPYCGREWHAITARLAAHRAATGTSPAVIVPVWWLPLPGDPPADIGRFQDTRDLFGPEYRRDGLRYLMQLKGNRDAYLDFVVGFTRLVLHAGRTPAAAVEPVDLATLPDAFAAGSASSAPPASPPPAGGSRRRVTFVVVAAGHDRMRAVRTAGLDVYGDDWDDWRPYHPECPDPIALRAQGVAMSQRLLSWFQPADENLFELLDAAQRRRELAVLIVDPWAVGLPGYNALLEQLNTRRYGTTSIIVPWEDPEPDSAVRDVLHVVLENWTDGGDSVFRDDIGSMREFEERLAQVLVDIRASVLRKAEVARRVREAGPTSRPLLTGPGS
ncbi:TIR-like protein FxsC [Actinosynnema sp. NPDC053489]|uniref:TIR-like protein FxsC n=1 Tax=Actinosynnema sp. NPDC053489 TaxID=3363916 RepID=UPI0037CC938F